MAEAAQEGFTIWFTGLSGAGKTTISRTIERRLRSLGARVVLLDGDVIRTKLCKGLGFTKEDRDENIRRLGFVAQLLSENGVIAIIAAISPYSQGRQEVRDQVQRFVEVYVKCPISVLIARDTKGLYSKAIRGILPDFTGISAPYEPPLQAELVVDSSTQSPEESAADVWDMLVRQGLIKPIRVRRSRTAPSLPAQIASWSA